MAEHTILIAFNVVEGSIRSEAMEALQSWLMDASMPFDKPSPVDGWWVAHDDRTDASDCDSAVFVPKGNEREASVLLHAAGLTPSWNVVGEDTPAEEGAIR